MIVPTNRNTSAIFGKKIRIYGNGRVVTIISQPLSLQARAVAVSFSATTVSVSIATCDAVNKTSVVTTAMRLTARVSSMTSWIY